MITGPVEVSQAKMKPKRKLTFQMQHEFRISCMYNYIYIHDIYIDSRQRPAVTWSSTVEATGGVPGYLSIPIIKKKVRKVRKVKLPPKVVETTARFGGSYPVTRKSRGRYAVFASSEEFHKKNSTSKTCKSRWWHDSCIFIWTKKYASTIWTFHKPT